MFNGYNSVCIREDDIFKAGECRFDVKGLGIETKGDFYIYWGQMCLCTPVSLALSPIYNMLSAGTI
jgi:hypothetical protein